MKVRLTRDMRVQHKAGEVIDVTDPAVLHFLLSTNSAVALEAERRETPEADQEKTTKRTVRKK